MNDLGARERHAVSSSVPGTEFPTRRPGAVTAARVSTRAGRYARLPLTVAPQRGRSRAAATTFAAARRKRVPATVGAPRASPYAVSAPRTSCPTATGAAAAPYHRPAPVRAGSAGRARCRRRAPTARQRRSPTPAPRRAPPAGGRPKRRPPPPARGRPAAPRRPARSSAPASRPAPRWPPPWPGGRWGRARRCAPPHRCRSGAGPARPPRPARAGAAISASAASCRSVDGRSGCASCSVTTRAPHTASPTRIGSTRPAADGTPSIARSRSTIRRGSRWPATPAASSSASSELGPRAPVGDHRVDHVRAAVGVVADDGHDVCARKLAGLPREYGGEVAHRCLRLRVARSGVRIASVAGHAGSVPRPALHDHRWNEPIATARRSYKCPMTTPDWRIRRRSRLPSEADGRSPSPRRGTRRPLLRSRRR